MLTLGIESTCDETALSIVEDGWRIRSNVLFSQIKDHAPFGGVVPELAARAHLDNVLPLLDKALAEAGVFLSDLDLIAASSSPGLLGAIMVGLTFAKTLSLATGIPFIGVNHIEAHLLSPLMQKHETPPFPAIGVVVSGGHTVLFLLERIGCYKLLGQTIDDAAGEAFDKVARMLGLPYPGGPAIEKIAVSGDPYAFPFRPGKCKNPFDFSFSGLKTKVLYTLSGQNQREGRQEISLQKRNDIAASFQRCAIYDIVEKAELAAKKYGCKTIVFGGGVSCNTLLASLMDQRSGEITSIFPEKNLCLDNGAMIASLGTHRYLHDKKGSPLTLLPQARVDLNTLAWL